MDKTIVVTEEDIRLGKPKSAGSCPIARAVERTIGLKVEVGEDMVEMLGAHNSGKDFFLPWKARNFIERFDAGLVVQPFEFEPLVSPGDDEED